MLKKSKQTSMITDAEWKEYIAWWKSRWSDSAPHRASVEKYLEWKEEKIRQIDWKWIKVKK